MENELCKLLHKAEQLTIITFNIATYNINNFFSEFAKPNRLFINEVTLILTL